MTDKVRLEVDGAIAVITNDNQDKHNAFDDEMDLRLFEILAELKERKEVRAVIWRAEASRGRRGETCLPSATTRPSSPTTSS